MNPDCNILNPLQRDGTSQEQRLVRALHPSYVLVDEREISDLLLYAREYARLIQFYSLENNPSGDWRKFIEADVSILISIIVEETLQDEKDEFDEQLADIETTLSQYHRLLTPTYHLIQKAYDWYSQSIPNLKLNTQLENLVNSILNDLLRNIISYALRLEELGDLSAPSKLLAPPFLGAAHPLLDNIAADSSLFPDGDLANEDHIEEAIDRFKREFRTAYESLLSIVRQAPQWLEETLESYPKHQPQMALFLAFLLLFKIARDHLNTITKRHLDFYYQEVLQLDLRPETPDEVHLVFQLAKNFETHRLEKDVLFKAGKDDANTNIFYGADDEIVINKTQLVEDGLKTVFLDKYYYKTEGTEEKEVGLPTERTDYIIRNIYAAPDADSADGLGADLENQDGKWATLGNGDMPYARVGFAISSPIFLLREGTRTIELTFHFESVTAGIKVSEKTLAEKELRHNVKVRYTGDKEWTDTAINSVVIDTGANTIKFEIILSPEAPSCIAYDEELHASGLSAQHPTLEFILDNEGISADFTIDLDTRQINTIPDLKSAALPYINGNTYQKNDLINYHGRWYKATRNNIMVPPVEGSSKWEDLGIEPSYPYRYLLPLKLTQLNLVVDVTGMSDLILENDLGVLNPSKPFLPFGPLPKKGSKFYIGSQEVFQKKLDHITLTLEWADLPEESFTNHYNEYREDTDNDGDLDGSSPISSNQHFSANIELLYRGQWLSNTAGSPLQEGAFTLFGTDLTGGKPNPERSEEISFNENNMDRAVDLAPFTQVDPNLMSGFLRLNLQTSFLHKQYPKWITRAAIKNKPQWTPNEPYTPTISTFSLNYRSEENLIFNDIAFDQRVEQLFHFSPFGWNEYYPVNYKIDPKKAVVSPHIVPTFEVTKVKDVEEDADPGSVDAEGTLYIGLQDLEPEQNVSILFQIAEGSADPDLQKQEVVWSYLANNEWVDFENTQILADRTNDLLTSGIITFVMPKAMTDDNTILPGEKTYWIKGSVAQQTKAVSKAIAVLPQAVKASFRKESGNDLSRLADPLPPETISKLRERRAALKKTLQPFASFNGQLKEQNETPADVTGDDRFKHSYNEFYIRVSERLRHKNRAVTIFDYERLVLQNFPDVYKVKCLNHTRIATETASASEHAPGYVKVIVLPNLRNRNAVDPLKPKISLNRLEEIKAFLNPLKCDFVTLEVRNPIFEKVNVSFNVKFLPGKDKGFYKKKLREDIVRFLSPWLYDEGADLQLGGAIHRSVILNKIEETDYVDYLTDFKMNHIIEYPTGEVILPDVEAAIAKTSSSVIVSDLAEKHKIEDVDIQC